MIALKDVRTANHLYITDENSQSLALHDIHVHVYYKAAVHLSFYSKCISIIKYT